MGIQQMLVGGGWFRFTITAGLITFAPNDTVGFVTGLIGSISPSGFTGSTGSHTVDEWDDIEVSGGGAAVEARLALLGGTLVQNDLIAVIANGVTLTGASASSFTAGANYLWQWSGSNFGFVNTNVYEGIIVMSA